MGRGKLPLRLKQLRRPEEAVDDVGMDGDHRLFLVRNQSLLNRQHRVGLNSSEGIASLHLRTREGVVQAFFPQACIRLGGRRISIQSFDPYLNAHQRPIVIREDLKANFRFSQAFCLTRFWFKKFYFFSSFFFSLTSFFTSLAAVFGFSTPSFSAV